MNRLFFSYLFLQWLVFFNCGKFSDFDRPANLPPPSPLRDISSLPLTISLFSLSLYKNPRFIIHIFILYISYSHYSYILYLYNIHLYGILYTFKSTTEYITNITKNKVTQKSPFSIHKYIQICAISDVTMFQQILQFYHNKSLFSELMS